MKILHTINTLPSGPASSLLLLELEQLSSELGKHLFLLGSHEGWCSSLLSQSFPRISIAIWIRYVSMFSGTNILISLILFNSAKDEKIQFKNKLHRTSQQTYELEMVKYFGGKKEEGGQRKCSPCKCRQPNRNGNGVRCVPRFCSLHLRDQNQVSAINSA